MPTFKPTLTLLITVLLLLSLTSCGNNPKINAIDSNTVILAYGDSITLGYGVDPEDSYPAILEGKLGCAVINAGVNGEDSSEGLQRLSDTLNQHNPDLVILCLGGNDMLRKQSLKKLRVNLKAMIEMIQNQGSQVILLGVPKAGLRPSVPPLYKELADECAIPYEGKVLLEVLTDNNLKSDYIHPNKEGYYIIADKLSALIKLSENKL